MSQQRPDNARILVGQRHRCHIFISALEYATEPAAGLGPLELSPFALPVNHRTRPVDQQGSEVADTAFADAQQVLLAPAGVLPGHQAQPGGDLPAVVKVFWRPRSWPPARWR